METARKCQFVSGIIIEKMCLLETTHQCAVCGLWVCGRHYRIERARTLCPQHWSQTMDTTSSSDSFRSSSSGSSDSSKSWSGEGGQFSGAGASQGWDENVSSDSKAAAAPAGSGLSPTDAALAFSADDYKSFEKMADAEGTTVEVKGFDS